MGTLFENVKSAVTAEEAARVYALEFGRNHRALCPWHSDTHPDLAFYDEGRRCYCHACHNGGDVIALTAQIFSLTPLDAARRLKADFHLDAEDERYTPSAAPTRAQTLKGMRDWRRKRFGYVCDVEKAARESTLAAEKGGWDSPEFRQALRAMALAQDECELLHAIKDSDLPDWCEVS